MHIFTNPNYNFLRWRWHAIALSWVIIIAGVVTIWTGGLRKGVEFAGGTVVIEQFDQAVSVQQVREALDKNYVGGGKDAIVQSTGDPAAHMVMIRVPQVGSEAGPFGSLDGGILYYLSRRDGFQCIWAQHLDKATKRPTGAPFDITHFHSARHRVHEFGFGPGVAVDKLVCTLSENTGNIWMAQMGTQH